MCSEHTLHANALFGIYIHWPFCAAKCPYCDFNSHVAETIDHERWLSCYLNELSHYHSFTKNQPVSSVFFGGGTPSLMKPDIVEAILNHIAALWGMTSQCEITLEANPTSIEYQKFRAFSTAGINRVSIGVQALNDKDLKFLGRQHSSVEAIEAIKTAQSVFDRYSFDLIYARPDQILSDWEKELKGALQYVEGHLSLYQLTIEKGTPFYMQYGRGDFIIPDTDLAGDFYDLTQDILEAEGLPAYEVSNHAAYSEESRHNLIYWRYNDYIGVGPGAHGRLTNAEGQKLATRGHRAPESWMERVEQTGCGAHPFDILAKEEEWFEAVMMGLRLKDGIPKELLLEKEGLESKIKALAEEGLLIVNNDMIAASREGRLRLNSLLSYLLPS